MCHVSSSCIPDSCWFFLVHPGGPRERSTDANDPQKTLREIGVDKNKLRFAGVGWSAIHLRDFVEVLPSFTKLRSLNLVDNDLRDDGAKILSSCLKATVSGTVRPWFMSTTDGVDT